MAERAIAERIIQELHAARVAGDLAAMCRLFSEQGHFRIAGASADKPIAISADDLASFRPWLGMLVKAFRINDYQLLSLVVEWPKATAHWRADIFSKITGVSVPTELVDLIELKDARIVAYSEFFVPR
ncbi:MAG: nuclear transport factor 2 family protein [Steroidobacteraceae bacterium]|jgi:ketosteroid isomerase-like protein